MQKEMLIGEVTGVHGVRGEMKIRPLTDDPGRFYDLEEVILDRKGKRQVCTVEMVRLHKGSVLMAVEEIPDRNGAEAMKDAQVLIPREEAVDLNEDEFFISDLIGMTVQDDQGIIIGKVKDVLTTTGSVDTLEIKTESKTIYVPFRKIYFSTIDFEKRIIIGQIPQDFFNL